MKKINKSGRIIIAICLIIIVGLAIFLPIYLVSLNTYSMIASPVGLSAYNKPVKQTVDYADFYVSVNTGDDQNSGTSAEAPLKSIEKAQSEVRKLISNGYGQNITVAVMSGEYDATNGLNFSTQDSFDGNNTVTYISYNQQEVVLNGGIGLPYSKFEKLDAETKNKFYPSAQNHIKVINLFDFGLTQAQIGKLYAVGGFEQGEKYGEEKGHPSAVELFYDDQRMSIARYPNDGYSTVEKIIDYGEAEEHSPDTVIWDTAVSPRPPKLIASSDMIKRMSRWTKPQSELNSMWAFGYYYWDWADASSPISSFDAASGQIDLKYSSPYGIKEDAIFYVYNVLEELDQEGEYYIDRDNGNMYFYPPTGFDENSDVQLSITTQSVINVESENEQSLIKNLAFDGFTIKGTRGDAVTLYGENCVLKNCLIKNSAQNGARVKGLKNSVINCEITRVGKNGVYVGYDLQYKEGDISNDIRRNGLVIENNNIKNNYIHKYGEIQKTYTSGVKITGVGNRVSNNEIFDAPHMGLFYEGNEHMIEYNYIHNVVKYSSDAGAIYAGRNFSYYGNVLRYNCIADIGSGEFTPAGIYFDDCLAGQTAYGNILINIPSYGILIGGGRENNIYNNMIINAKIPIHYDARAYDGRFNGGWYYKNTQDENSRQWLLMKDAQALYSSWKQNSKDIIGSRYDAIMNMSGYDDLYADNNAMNPNSRVVNNICISKKGNIGEVAKAAKMYSVIENNTCYKLSDKELGFVDFSHGNYALSEGKILNENPNFERIPLEKIGRINEND